MNTTTTNAQASTIIDRILAGEEEQNDIIQGSSQTQSNTTTTSEQGVRNETQTHANSQENPAPCNNSSRKRSGESLVNTRSSKRARSDANAIASTSDTNANTQRSRRRRTSTARKTNANTNSTPRTNSSSTENANPGNANTNSAPIINPNNASQSSENVDKSTPIKLVGFGKEEETRNRLKTAGFATIQNWSRKAQKIIAVYAGSNSKLWHGGDENVTHVNEKWLKDSEAAKKQLPTENYLFQNSPPTTTPSTTTPTARGRRQISKVWDVFEERKQTKFSVEDDFCIIEKAAELHSAWDLVFNDLVNTKHMCSHCTDKEQLRHRFNALEKKTSWIYKEIQVPPYTAPAGVTDDNEKRRLDVENTTKYNKAQARQERCRQLIEKIKRMKTAMASSSKNDTAAAIRDNIRAGEKKRKNVRERRTTHWENAAMVETTKCKQKIYRGYFTMKYLRDSLVLEKQLVEFCTGKQVDMEETDLDKRMFRSMEEDLEKVLALPQVVPIPEEELREEEEEEAGAEEDGREKVVGEGEKDKEEERRGENSQIVVEDEVEEAKDGEEEVELQDF